MGGISLMVIEKTKGVKAIQMNCQGVWASGTSYVTFEDVLVPVENILGKENKGFQLIMANFNPERIGIAIQANRFARVCYEEALSTSSYLLPRIRTDLNRLQSTHRSGRRSESSSATTPSFARSSPTWRAGSNRRMPGSKPSSSNRPSTMRTPSPCVEVA